MASSDSPIPAAFSSSASPDVLVTEAAVSFASTGALIAEAGALSAATGALVAEAGALSASTGALVAEGSSSFASSGALVLRGLFGPGPDPNPGGEPAENGPANRWNRGEGEVWTCIIPHAKNSVRTCRDARRVTPRRLGKNATATQRQAVRGLTRYGADLIEVIRAFADLQTDPAAVYTAAELDTPKPGGTPQPPPVPATGVRTQMDSTGAVAVGWTGTVANGTVYAVYRRFAQGAPYTQIGTSTTKDFVDRAVPVGTHEASYYVVTLRDGMESAPSEAVSIRFGAQLQPGDQSAGGQIGLAA